MKYFIFCLFSLILISCSSQKSVTKSNPYQFETIQYHNNGEELVVKNEYLTSKRTTEIYSDQEIEKGIISFNKINQKPIKQQKTYIPGRELNKDLINKNSFITQNAQLIKSLSESISNPDQNKINIKNYSKWSLIFGVLSILTLLLTIIFLKPVLMLMSIIFSVVAIKLGIISLKKINKDSTEGNESNESKTMAISGLILGSSIIIFLIIGLFLAISSLIIIID